MPRVCGLFRGFDACVDFFVVFGGTRVWIVDASHLIAREYFFVLDFSGTVGYIFCKKFVLFSNIYYYFTEPGCKRPPDQFDTIPIAGIYIPLCSGGGHPGL